MELRQTRAKDIRDVKANENGWELEATVTIEDNRVTEISGTANANFDEETRTYENSASFYGSLSAHNGTRGDDPLEIRYAFRKTDADVCSTLTAMVNAIVEAYGK